MKPGEEQPQNWQQPAQSPPQAPYQTAAIPAPDSTPPPLQSPAPVAPLLATPVPPVAQPAPQTLTPPAEASVSPASSQMPYTSEAQPELVAPIELPLQEDEYADEVAQDEDAVDTGNDVLLRWQATEYIHHERTILWYVILGIVVVIFIALALLVFHSITFAILIPVMLIALVVYIRRPPSILNYILSRKGLHINDHLYLYDQFKAFGVVSHEELHSVVLLPRKRFQVSQTVYFPEEVGERLVDMLAARLPMQEVHLDTIDRLLKKLRI